MTIWLEWNAIRRLLSLAKESTRFHDSESSVTRLGDLLDFGPLFKAFGNNLICPNLPHSQAIFVKVSKFIIFLVHSFLGNFYRLLVIFSGHTVSIRVVFSFFSFQLPFIFCSVRSLFFGGKTFPPFGFQTGWSDWATLERSWVTKFTANVY